MEESSVDFPFCSKIPGGCLKQWSMVFFRGVVWNKPSDFAIDFSAGRGEGSSIVLHMNARWWMLDNYLVLNCCEKNKWGAEERVANPFQVGRPFELMVHVVPDQFILYVNGTQRATFVHRLFAESVTHISGRVNPQGAASIRSIQVISGPVDGPPPGYSGVTLEWVNEVTPFKKDIPCLEKGNILYVIGTPYQKNNVGRFSIDFQQKGGEVIGFHFDARIDYSSEQNVVVRNAYAMKTWGFEERFASYFPFEYNAQFKLTIRFETDKFVVLHNDNKFIEFEHRNNIDLNLLRQIAITGNVHLHLVRFQ